MHRHLEKPNFTHAAYISFPSVHVRVTPRDTGSRHPLAAQTDEQTHECKLMKLQVLPIQ